MQNFTAARGVFVLLVWIVGMTSVEGVAAAAAGEEEGLIRVRVVDAATGEPVAGVKVVTWAGGGADRWDYDDATTDADGRATVERARAEGGDTAWQAWQAVTFDAEGYQPAGARWDGNDDGTPADVAGEHVIRLERGKARSGRVVDEEGRPVEAAEVVFNPGDYRLDDAGRGPQVGLRHHDVKYRTDADGRWSTTQVPGGAAGSVVTITHRNFPAMSARLDGGDVVLRAGVRVRGWVLDEAGRPVPDAWIHTKQTHYVWDPTRPVVRSDGEGEFELPVVAPGTRLPVAVRAAGKGPALQWVVAETGTVVEVVMGEPHPIAGRVVDESGRPVAGALLTSDGWRGTNALPLGQQSREDGTFRFGLGPPDEVEFQVNAKDYVGERSVTLRTGAENVIVLR